MLTGLTVDGSLALVVARGAADAAVLSAFGALLSRAWLAPPVLVHVGDGGTMRRLAWIGWLSFAASVLLTVIWLVLQSAELAGSASSALLVLQQTLFGHLVIARLGLLSLAALLFARRWFWPAAVVAGAAVATQAGHGHGLAMHGGPSRLLLSGVLHILAAGAWLGSLVPLLVLIASAPPAAAALASRRFSRLGTVCVTILAGTALYQGTVLVGSVTGLIGTGYGIIALAKTVLFAALLGFAARNRFRLTPALASGAPAQMRLVRSIVGETVLGLMVVLAAGLLTSLPPAMHEQPIWPLPWRLSLDAVGEDEFIRREAAFAGAVLVLAVTMTGVALLRRWRARLLVAACATIACVLAAPHLDVLLAEAYPTQYWQSPTGFASSSIAEGAALFRQYCVACHGTEGRGDGPVANGLPVPPADLSAEHLWAHADGELFWWVSHGIEGPDGRAAMPGFASTLMEGQRWALIDWVRANNAGLSRTTAGTWSRPVQAPSIEAICEGGTVRMLSDFRGEVVRIVFGPAAPVEAALTFAVTSDSRTPPELGLCVAGDAAVPLAYRTVTGLTKDRLAGAEIFVDAHGWLRVLHRAGEDKPDDAGAVAGMVRNIRDHPLAPGPTGHSGMRM